MCSTNVPNRRRGTSTCVEAGPTTRRAVYITDLSGESGQGRGCGDPWAAASRRRGLLDGEALLVAVLDQLVLPRLQTLVQVRRVLIGLSDRVAEDAVRVYLVRQVLPPGGHVPRAF